MKFKFPSLQSLWIWFGIPLTSFLILRPSFNLSLFGDDWEQLYFMWLEFDVRHSYHWFDIKSYLGPYNFSYLYLGIINHFFGLNSLAYFCVSFTTRVLATISIYLLVKYLVKNKLAAFLSSLIFILSMAGLETTNWVFNMNTYMGICLFNLALIFYLKIRSSAKISIKYYLIFIALFSSALVTVTTRLHGAVPFMIFLDLLLTFYLKRQKLSFNFFLRLATPIIILLILVQVGAFGHIESGGFTDRLKLGYSTATNLLQHGESIFLLFFPGIIGRVVLPDFFISGFADSFGLSWSALIYISILLLVSFFAIKKLDSKKTILSPSFLILLGLNIIWLLLIKFMHGLNPNAANNQLLAILIGGEFLFLLPWLFFCLKKRAPEIAFTMIFSWCWLVAFTILYWLFNPDVFIETTGRYMTMAAVGYAICFGVLISYLYKTVNKKLAGLPILLLVLWMGINIYGTSQYFNILQTDRNAVLAKSIWKSLTDSLTNLDTQNPTVFYFTTDNPNSLHWNVVFGFPSHMGITYKIPDLNNTPVPESDYPTMLQYAKDGSPLLKIHGRPMKKVPLDHIYAYHLSGNQLINQTALIREQISTDLKNQN